MVVLVCWCNGQQFVWWCWSVGVMVSSLYGGVTVSSLYGGVGLLV